MKSVLLATFAAIAVQPFVFFMWANLPALIAGKTLSTGELFGTPLFAALFAMPFVVLTGIPVHIILRRLNFLSWRSLGAVGFLAAALPIAIDGFAERATDYGGSWHGTSVSFVIEGKRTLYGWLSYAEMVLLFGLHGLIGALTFFFVWRFVESHRSLSKTDDLASLPNDR